MCTHSFNKHPPGIYYMSDILLHGMNKINCQVGSKSYKHTIRQDVIRFQMNAIDLGTVVKNVYIYTYVYTQIDIFMCI